MDAVFHQIGTARMGKKMTITKIICDRCGNEIIDKQLNHLNYKSYYATLLNTGVSEKIYDICPECEQSFIKWYNDGKDKNE